MERTILIPTDFRVASLNTLKIALDSYEQEKVGVLLVYSEFLDDSISGLLFYSPLKIINQKQSSEFKEALEILKNRFEGKISEISVSLFHSNNKAYRDNFIKGNKVSHIYLPQTYSFRVHGRAFDPLPIFKSSVVSVTEVKWEVNYNQTEQEQLISLFN